MFIAMNRFRVVKGCEAAFEAVWLSRDTHLDTVPGFTEFHLLRGPAAEDHTLYAKQPAFLRGHSGVVTQWARLPPLAQQIEHLRRQHDIAVLANLGLLDPDDFLRGCLYA